MKTTRFQELTTIAQPEMRAINRTAVLKYLRLANTASRTELSVQLKISKPTVKRIIDELVNDGWVLNLEEKEKGFRRSRDLLAIDSSGNLAIGIDLGGSHISGIVGNIGGEILYQSRIPMNCQAAEYNYEELLRFIDKLKGEAAKIKGRVLGVAVGVPGIVENKSGTVKIAPSLNWENFPLLDKLKSMIALPILLENDVNLAALGENWFGVGVGVENMVMVSIGTGIGAGIILEGRLYRGFRDSSGEIGYMLPGITYLDKKYPGFGALEGLASCKGIAEKAYKAAMQKGKNIGRETFDTEQVFTAAGSGEPWAKEIIAETIDLLSLAVANVSVIADPELIIIGGGIIGSAEQFIGPVKNRLKGVIPFIPEIAASALKSDAPLLGCVVRVFQKSVEYTVAQIM